MRRAEPNPGHAAVARLGADLVITQNVDGLHERAGTPRLVALHGRIADVVCLDCRTTTSRTALQDRLTALNPRFAERHAEVAVRPDGDVELDDTTGFVVPGCVDCTGTLKPDVVFFGENMPRTGRPLLRRRRVAGRERRRAAGRRLQPDRDVRAPLRAPSRQAGTPVVIVNRGSTRGDELATYRVETGCSEFLTELAG